MNYHGNNIAERIYALAFGHLLWRKFVSYSEMQIDNFNRESVVKIIDGHFL